MNVIVQLKFELIYYDVAVYHITHYAIETVPLTQSGSIC